MSLSSCSLSLPADTLPPPPPPPQQQHHGNQSSPSHAGSSHKQHASPSKPPKSQRPSERSSPRPQDVQSDQLQRAAALGPPGSPVGGRSVPEDQRAERLAKLEARVEEMAAMLDTVKAQVRRTAARVAALALNKRFEVTRVCRLPSRLSGRTPTCSPACARWRAASA